MGWAANYLVKRALWHWSLIKEAKQPTVRHRIEQSLRKAKTLEELKQTPFMRVAIREGRLAGEKVDDEAIRNVARQLSPAMLKQLLFTMNRKQFDRAGKAKTQPDVLTPGALPPGAPALITPYADPIKTPKDVEHVAKVQHKAQQILTNLGVPEAKQKDPEYVARLIAVLHRKRWHRKPSERGLSSYIGSYPLPTDKQWNEMAQIADPGLVARARQMDPVAARELSNQIEEMRYRLPHTAAEQELYVRARALGDVPYMLSSNIKRRIETLRRLTPIFGERAAQRLVDLAASPEGLSKAVQKRVEDRVMKLMEERRGNRWTYGLDRPEDKLREAVQRISELRGRPAVRLPQSVLDFYRRRAQLEAGGPSAEVDVAKFSRGIIKDIGEAVEPSGKTITLPALESTAPEATTAFQPQSALWKGFNLTPEGAGSPVSLLEPTGQVFASGYPQVAAHYARAKGLVGFIPRHRVDPEKKLLYTPHVFMVDEGERARRAAEVAKGNLTNVWREEEKVNRMPHYETVIPKLTPEDITRLYAARGRVTQPGGAGGTGTLEMLNVKGTKTPATMEAIKAKSPAVAGRLKFLTPMIKLQD